MRVQQSLNKDTCPNVCGETEIVAVPPPPSNLLLHLFVVLCVIIFLKMVFVLRFQVCVSILFGIAQIGSTNRKVDQMEKANFEKPP